ncbi:MAG: hypothetical protein A3F93_02095 [Candidatus Magasanikbacteria bacterium RIFCSPLOWO2_12_FULL_34_7]|nr:MAG: hypothetical protein A3F93_02095 [Candidatus Magasanikbacteria bacterium RIFCSPLOWO2_12_FULL_34_7]
MQTFLLIFLSIGLIGAIILIYLMYKKIIEQGKPKEGEQNQFTMLQNQMQELNRAFEQRMTEANKSMFETQNDISKTLREQHGQSSRIITEITEKLTSLDKTNQQVIGFSEQLSNLEKVLKSQKQRGNLGEAGLRLVLGNILPPNAFHLQYSFKDGDTVDAAIITKDGLIPVDAKFSLENYQKINNEKDDIVRTTLEKEFKQDLKKRIDETAKYIKPKEGTLEFAFMFIPSEAIYYDLLVNEIGAVKVNTRDLIDYAFIEKKVVIVSPTTFAAYLQTVLQGLRAFKIEEGAKSIRKNVEALGKHIKTQDEFMKKLGNSLGTTVNHYNTAYKELSKVDKDILKITESKEEVIDPIMIDKPNTEQ